MLKLLTVQFRERELAPIMLLVAADAVDLTVGNVVGACMVADMLFHAAADFDMTIQAFEAVGAQAKIMAGGAFGGAFQRLVGPREGSGRDLRTEASRE